MSKPKVLYLTNNLMSYRVPILNILAQRYDLTVAFSEGKLPQEKCNFQIIQLSPTKAIGPILWNNEDISQLCDQFDVVLSLGQVFRIKYGWQVLRPGRKFKMIFWSIGVSASYTKHYDQDKRLDCVRDFFYKKADACVFYTDYPVRKNLMRGYKPEAMFVANNTVEVLPISEQNKKDSILFIGSLYKAKGIDILLNSYKEVYSQNKALPNLNIVGGGAEYDEIKAWISDNGLENKINLVGPVYDIQKKKEFFERAYACISPSQAGLSVLESMGYGVPFVTSRNAFTGGEIFNIQNEVTGILMDNEEDLPRVLSDIATNPDKFVQLGENAKRFYAENRTPEMMAKGISDAIEFTLSL